MTDPKTSTPGGRQIIVSLEGLTPAALSCYGNAWNRTPAIDSLAADGVVWDRVICHVDDPQRLFVEATAMLRGRPATLITDDGKLNEEQLRVFGKVDRFDLQFRTQPATSVDETHFAKLVEQSVKRLEESATDGIVWLHSQFLTRHWDAPSELAEDESWADESEESGASINANVFEALTPPRHRCEKNDDVDLVNAWMQRYACQIRLIDELMDRLIEAGEEADATVVLMGTSGFSLGQNGWIGHAAGPLRSCHLHVPLLVGRGGPLRVAGLLGTDRVAALLGQVAASSDGWLQGADWAADPAVAPPVTTSSVRVSRCVTTPRWFHVHDSEGSDYLYLKPDDLNDANNVSRLRPDVVDELLDG